MPKSFYVSKRGLTDARMSYAEDMMLKSNSQPHFFSSLPNSPQTKGLDANTPHQTHRKAESMRMDRTIHDRPIYKVDPNLKLPKITVRTGSV
jgi:hypothetical protein